MKKQCALIVAVVATCLLFFSCGENRFPRSLVVADSLAEENPDSAVKYIRTLRKKVSNYSKREELFYELMRVKTDDKAYIEHGLKDTVMVDAATYFESTGPDSLAAVAWYYAGSVFRDLKNEPQALDYYQRAQNIMPANMSPKFKSRLYGQMGQLFLRQDLYANARDMMKKALSYDIQNKDTMEMVYSYSDLSTLYNNNNMLDSSFYYLRKAYQLSLLTTNVDIQNAIFYKLAFYYYQEGQYDKALSFANNYKTLGKDDKEVKLILLCMIQKERNALDSVKMYCHKILKSSTSNENIGFAYYYLGITYALEGNGKEAANLFSQYKNINDANVRKNSSEIIARMNSVYNYQKEQKKVIHLKWERKLIYSFCGLGVLVTAFLIFVFYMKSKDNKQRVKIVSLQLEQLKMKTAEYEKKSIVEKNEEKDEIYNSSIFKRMTDVAQHGQDKLAITREEWTDFEDLINKVYPKFSSKLRTLYELSEIELHVSLLIKAGFKPKDISNIVNRSQSALSSIRRRLYKKVYNIDPIEPADWDRVIISL